jgi:RNA-binding protein YlmH
VAHAFYHAKSSAKRFGGEASDYLEYHEFLDQTKLHFADARHRLILHNSFGIGLAEQVFGAIILRMDGREVPLRPVLEQHILEDLGRIPTLEQCLSQVKLESWMYKNAEQLSQKDEETSNDSNDHIDTPAIAAAR